MLLIKKCLFLILCCVSSRLPAESLTCGMPQGRSTCSRVGQFVRAGPELSWFPSAQRALGSLEPLPRVLRAGKVSCRHQTGKRNSGDKKPFLVQVAYNTETSEFHT